MLLIQNPIFHYESHESIASTYMNRVVIEEEDQFEIGDILAVDDRMDDPLCKLDESMRKIKKKINLTKKENRGLVHPSYLSNQLHIIWAGSFWHESKKIILRNIRPVIERYGYESAMLSNICMYKEKCITKAGVLLQPRALTTSNLQKEQYLVQFCTSNNSFLNFRLSYYHLVKCDHRNKTGKIVFRFDNKCRISPFNGKK